MNARGWFDQAERADAALYAAVARIDVPKLDRAMSGLSSAANYSRLWLGAGALLALFGGAGGRRAAVDGAASVAVTSIVVNAVMKPLLRRPRPERGSMLPRHVRMPRSRSFPSGHAASAFAFVTGVARTRPDEAAPLRVLAVLVAYSRVHTGVHFPADVAFGGLLGVAFGHLTSRARERR